MAGILNEYLNKKMSVIDLQNELSNLVHNYNVYTGRYLLVFASDFCGTKLGIPDISMNQDDFYNIQDLLRETTADKVDVYIETPGGSGEAAEEIARFLHKKFNEVNFVIASEAKSAGTILVLSGDNIYMTETGSLGPIDAQMRIGRTVQSAYDYKEWVEQKRLEAIANGGLNPVDAQIIAQITPGELAGVVNALEFAKDLVSNWLVQYKFKNWTTKQTTGEFVTDEIRKSRANEVAEKLCNHSLWRSHGRSIKVEDLENLLTINRIDDDAQLSDIVYRIKIVLKLLFGSSSIYKIYKTEDLFLSKTAVIANKDASKSSNSKNSSVQVEKCDIELECPRCHKRHKVEAFIGVDKQTASQIGIQKNPLIDANNNLVCDGCNFAIDLKPLINQIEQQKGKKVII